MVVLVLEETGGAVAVTDTFGAAVVTEVGLLLLLLVLVLLVVIGLLS